MCRMFEKYFSSFFSTKITGEYIKHRETMLNIVKDIYFSGCISSARTLVITQESRKSTDSSVLTQDSVLVSLNWKI